MHYSIFYTDDDKDDQDMFKDAVDELSEPVRLTIHGGGNELMEVLNEGSTLPNVLFLDLNMPVKTGYDVLKEIRSSDKTKDLPVVIFTTSSHHKAIETTRKLGASLYVTKPPTYASLKKILKSVIAINWKTFSSSDNEFVFRLNNKI